MIESVDLIVAALGAGAAAGASNAASTAVKDAYEALQNLTRKALRRNLSNPDNQADALIEAQLADPEAHRNELESALVAAGAEADTLLTAAQRILELTDPQGATAGKYQVELHGNTGVQVGDRNTMTLNLKTSGTWHCP